MKEELHEREKLQFADYFNNVNIPGIESLSDRYVVLFHLYEENPPT